MPNPLPFWVNGEHRFRWDCRYFGRYASNAIATTAVCDRLHICGNIIGLVSAGISGVTEAVRNLNACRHLEHYVLSVSFFIFTTTGAIVPPETLSVGLRALYEGNFLELDVLQGDLLSDHVVSKYGLFATAFPFPALQCMM